MAKRKKKKIIQFCFEKNFVLGKEDRDIRDNRRSSEGEKKPKVENMRHEIHVCGTPLDHLFTHLFIQPL